MTTRFSRSTISQRSSARPTLPALSARSSTPSCHFLENKDEFNKLYKKYIGREFVQLQEATKEEVEKFCSEREYIFCKMQDLECGHGCERIKISDYSSFDELYKYLTDKGFCTLEDNIEQHSIPTR